ncbi:tetratricopeptide repeat protein [Microtetraspora sp. AC03309]|uniref:AfsR/SARP family transcriptional regulator n=1 Tax=Microtetraspora sp. AC03309 TaxID=2779376 RepID=UPI001E50F0BE|nr:tetratricopeptide repeat protein [Microtetraspora sp. AC03309]MCC5575797.1 tetratricopeptide repeat protein [Microtetraspora sp. AC03309]
MHFRILGTLEISREGIPMPLTAPKQRALLALLLLCGDHAVPAARLVDELWGSTPPRSADSTLYSLVSRLRRAGVDRIVREPGGYRLPMEGATLDLHTFQRRASRARELTRDGRPGDAAELYRRALALWRSTPLADVPASPLVTAERDRIGALRLAAVEEYADVLAMLDQHTVSVPELRRTLANHPLNESLWARLVRALARSGRTGEALAAYGTARRVLAEELGLEPCEELRNLHAWVLRGGIPQPADHAAQGPLPQAPDPQGPDPQAPGAPETESPGMEDPGASAAHPQDDPVEAPGSPVPRWLPPDLDRFTGRAAELRELRSAATADVTVISGMPGVGKSALAVHWAHRAAAHFPDGQLFIDLRGHRPRQAVTPRDALDRLVRALGLPPERVPADEDDLGAAFRTLLSGKRVLIVLDNAADPSQVRQLLPGEPGCLVLVTSRNRLTGLALRHRVRVIELAALSEPEAVALLTTAIAPARPPDPAAVAELARQCGRLPLALRIAAAHLADNPGRTVARFVADLTERGRLRGLRLPGDPHDAVGAAFDLSYRTLARADRVAFRRLGLVPGGEFTPPALAAMLASTPARARAHLDALRTASLIESRRDAPGEERYRFHDLLHDYARHRAEKEDSPAVRAATVARLMGWYISLAAAPADPAPLHAEHESLLAAVRYAAAHGLDAAWRLPAALARHLELRQRLHDAVEMHTLAVAAATRAERLAQAAAANDHLATVLRHLGRYPDALAAHRHALETCRRLGDRRGVSAALRGIGTVRAMLGHYDEALVHLGQALRIDEDAGDDGALAGTLTVLGLLARNLGRLEEAVARYERALDIHRRTGDIVETARVLNNLGVAREEQGRHAEALDLYRQALDLYRTLGSRKGQGRAINNIGLVLVKLGRADEALGHLLQGLAIHRDNGDRRGEAEASNDLADLYHRLGRRARALEHFERALRIRAEIGDRRGLAETHRDLGDAYAEMGEEAAARRHHDAAAEIFVGLGLRPTRAR